MAWSRPTDTIRKNSCWVLIRILIADDSALLRESLTSFLAQEPGFEVVASVGDGLEAVEAANLQGPDVVVMDCRLPRLDGFEATRRIRGRHPATGVVLLTSYAGDRAEAMTAGADALLLKDCAPEELIEAIRRAGTPERSS